MARTPSFNARYSPPPCGALPDTSALRRIARHLAVSNTVAGWNRPCDVRDQWVVTRDSGFQEEPGRAENPPASVILDRWKQDIDLEERQQRKDLNKPLHTLASGPWWSTPPLGIGSSTGRFKDASPVGLWCVEDGFGWREASAQKIEVHDERPVFEVTGPEAWAQLCRDYPMEVSAVRRRNWFEASGRDGRWLAIMPGCICRPSGIWPAPVKPYRWMRPLQAWWPAGRRMPRTGSPTGWSLWATCTAGFFPTNRENAMNGSLLPADRGRSRISSRNSSAPPFRREMSPDLVTLRNWQFSESSNA